MQCRKVWISYVKYVEEKESIIGFTLTWYYSLIIIMQNNKFLPCIHTYRESYESLMLMCFGSAVLKKKVFLFLANHKWWEDDGDGFFLFLNALSLSGKLQSIHFKSLRFLNTCIPHLVCSMYIEYDLLR